MQKLNQMSRYSFLKTDDESAYNHVKYRFSEKKGEGLLHDQSPWKCFLIVCNDRMKKYFIITQFLLKTQNISTVSQLPSQHIF